MNDRSSWPLWAGFVLTIAAFFSYLAIFVNFPSTRDVPWATFLLFVFALALVVIGLRRVFSKGTTRGKKITGSVVGTLTVLVMGFFMFAYFVAGKQLPASKGAPVVGHKAPEFRLTDSNGNTVALSQLLTTPIDGRTPKGILLVFYRGYW